MKKNSFLTRLTRPVTVFIVVLNRCWMCYQVPPVSVRLSMATVADRARRWALRAYDKGLLLCLTVSLVLTTRYVVFVLARSPRNALINIVNSLWYYLLRFGFRPGMISLLYFRFHVEVEQCDSSHFFTLIALVFSCNTSGMRRLPRISLIIAVSIHKHTRGPVQCLCIKYCGRVWLYSGIIAA